MNLKSIMLSEISHIQKYRNAMKRQLFMAFLYFFVITFVEDSLFKHVCKVFRSLHPGQKTDLFPNPNKQYILSSLGQSLHRFASSICKRLEVS